MEESGRRRVATLVFMDLESTGLPCDVGRKNVHITEMSLVAIDRCSFEEDKNLRVLNKISLCVRPRAIISPGSMNITGLYNDILENQEEFDDSVPKLLEYFFRRLQKPICLLAHNGNRFDFPVLQAELKRLNFSLGSDIVCADTLVAFRSICKLKKQLEAEKKSKEEEIAKEPEKFHLTDEDIDNLLSQDLESFSQIETKLDDGISGSKPNGMLSPTHGEKTPPLPPKNTTNQSTVNTSIKRKMRDSTIDFPKKKFISARKTLFPEPGQKTSFNSPVLEIQNITKFSLIHLYKFFYKQDPPNSHYAEIDTITLSKVCQQINRDFLNWVDENHVEFSTIDALW